MKNATKQQDEPTIKAIAPWFGGNRMLAPAVSEELAGCTWVGIPFAGGMSELLHVRASTIAVNDLHRHVINLARVIADPARCRVLCHRLSRLPFHPEILADAQAECLDSTPSPNGSPNVDAATNYFVASWMSRSGHGGTSHEFTGTTPVRWQANGGDSNTRYRSAVRSIVAWNRTMRRCNFTVLDAFEFLSKCKNVPQNGIYCDPPFPEGGHEYRHRFNDHHKLRDVLAQFRRCRVVIRYYDHPLVRDLYPEPEWTWRRLKGRKQSNAEAPEVLILNGPSKATAAGLFSTPEE